MYHLRTTQNGKDRSQPGIMGQDRSSEVRDLPRNRERVTGVEPATLCLAIAATSVTTSSDVSRRRDFTALAPSRYASSGRRGTWEPGHPTDTGERGAAISH